MSMIVPAPTISSGRLRASVEIAPSAPGVVRQVNMHLTLFQL
jgi:hypothetical protein